MDDSLDDDPKVEEYYENISDGSEVKKFDRTRRPKVKWILVKENPV